MFLKSNDNLWTFILIVPRRQQISEPLLSGNIPLAKSKNTSKNTPMGKSNLYYKLWYMAERQKVFRDDSGHPLCKWSSVGKWKALRGKWVFSIFDIRSSSIFLKISTVSRQLSNIFICACVQQHQLFDNKCECEWDKDTQYWNTLPIYS